VRDKRELLDEMATEIWRRVSAEGAALPADLPWDRVMAEGAALPADLPWDRVMAEFAAITRRALLAHRDGAKVFSGTYLTDPGVLEAQQDRFARMVKEGFSVADATRAYSLLYSFTIGFCIEEQASAQAAAIGDNRFSEASRAARIDARAHPVIARAARRSSATRMPASPTWCP
jgi:hypothetical protein